MNVQGNRISTCRKVVLRNGDFLTPFGVCVCKPLKHREWKTNEDARMTWVLQLYAVMLFSSCELKLFTSLSFFFSTLAWLSFCTCAIFRFTAGGHGSIHQSVANEATDVWRGYAVWSTARTCYRRIQAWQESRSGTDVKRWRGTRVVWFLVSTLLGICLMCCLLSDWGRSGSTMFELIKVNVIQLNFRGRSLVWRLNLLHLADMFDVWFFDFLHFASCWTVDVWLIACPFLQLRLRAIGHRRPGATLSYQDVAWQLQFLPISVSSAWGHVTPRGFALLCDNRGPTTWQSLL